MALVTTAGTETIRTVMMDDVDSTTTVVIAGEQHHIYTVLSIVFHAAVWQASGNFVKMIVQGYDSKGGTTNSGMTVFKEPMKDDETFVFNDKFSFNGFEPISFTGPLSTVAHHDAIASQGSGVSQELRIYTQHADDQGHLILTYIDQNNE